MKASNYYSGWVQGVTYDDPTTAFYILKVQLDADKSYLRETVVTKGHIPGIEIRENVWISFEGTLVTHPKYGNQIQITRAPLEPSVWTPDQACKALLAHGLPAPTVDLLKYKFGDQIPAVFKRPDLLAEVLDTASLANVLERWHFVHTQFRVIGFLNSLGLTSAKVQSIWAHFGDRAEEVLNKSPWELLQIEGFTFKQADDIALKVGVGLDHPERLRGAILWCCRGDRNFGHLFNLSGDLYEQVRREVPDIQKERFAKALTDLHKEQLLVIDRDTRPGNTAVYEPWFYVIEKASAEALVTRCASASFSEQGTQKYMQGLTHVGPRATEKVNSGGTLEEVILSAIEDWATGSAIKLSALQVEGVKNALLHPVSVLTGLPGTGKSTALRAVVSVLRDSGLNVLLTAPTGIAAKNLTAVTGMKAFTLHKAFQAKGVSEENQDWTYTGVTRESSGSKSETGEEGEWGYGPGAWHPADVILVDEASMIDQHILYRLLTGTSPTCRIVFVGDHAQLPSVGPGNVLRDLISSALFPVVSLTEIFRQKGESDIVYAAHAIHGGQVPPTNTPDFKLVEVQGEADALELITKLAKKLYDSHANFQIISPRHAGVVGVTNLNALLRELINPSDRNRLEIKLKDDVLREEDRVMVVKNSYKHMVYNGDVGKIDGIDRTAKKLKVKIHGDPPQYVDMSFQEATKLLRLSYACTVHKIQGLEFDTIIMPLVDGFRHQLQRNLLYTAVTRARKRVVLVGTLSALGQAVSNGRVDQRNTMFLDRLLKAVPGRVDREEVSSHGQKIETASSEIHP